MKTELLQEINWDILKEEVTINNTVDTNKIALLRSDNNQLLGIVGKDYCPVSNVSLMELTNALTEHGNFELKGFDELRDGKTILAFLQNKNPGLTMNAFAMNEYLIIGNSHDGSKPFYIGTGCSLIRCENQFYSTLQVFRKKHYSPIAIDLYSVNKLIKTYNSKKRKIYESFDGMENVRVDQTVIDRLVKEVHKMLTTDSTILKKEDWGWSPSMRTLRKSIDKEIAELGNNAFGLFNGVTWYTSHEMRNAGSDFGLPNGTANKINQKAFRFCNTLKRTALHDNLIMHK
jgi:hypothetical protein